MTIKAQAQTAEEAKAEQEEVSLNGALDDEEEDLVLDLDELTAKRTGVVFGGKRYELRAPQDFDIEAEHHLRVESKEFNQLKLKDSLNKAERAKMRARLDHLVNKVLIAPQEIKDRLNDKQRQWVVAYFSVVQLNEEQSVTEKLLPQMQLARELADSTSAT